MQAEHAAPAPEPNAHTAAATASAEPGRIYVPAEAIPAWAQWWCETDDTYWSPQEGAYCWFCGNPGTMSHRPIVTSQQGWDATWDDIMSPRVA